MMTTRQGVMIGLLFILCLMMIGQFSYLLSDRSIWPPDDYVEYWAAGRLNYQGENPYSPELLLPWQQFAGRDTDTAIMMWNPPWTLSWVMPLGSLPPRLGQFCWLLVSLLALLGSTLWYSQQIGISRYRGPMITVLTLTFMPSLFLLHVGQIGALILLGLVGFHWALQKQQYFYAGLFTILIAIKPHLVYLLWVGLIYHAFYAREFRIILGAVVAGLFFSLIPVLFNPHVFSQYFEAYRTHPPAEHVSLTIGILLRLIFGIEHFWLQFLPMGLGLLWFVLRAPRRKPTLFTDHLPALILVSFITAPYGAWHFDLVLLLIPVIHALPRLQAAPASFLKSSIIGLWVTANLAMLILSFTSAKSWWLWWVAPFIAVLYSFAGRLQLTPCRPETAKIYPASSLVSVPV